MHDHGIRIEADLPAAPSSPPAPLEVLDVHEEALVQRPDVLEGEPGYQQRGTNRPVDRPGAVVCPRADEHQLVGTLG